MKRIFYRLGGTTLDVIQHCSPDIRTKYQNLAYSLLLSTGLATIGGFDIARQFTNVLAICIGVALLWGIAVFAFDYFINNSTGKGFFKLIRIPVGIANVTITVIALFVLLNQSTIDSKLRLANSGKITASDSSYLLNKNLRYAQVEEQKKNREVYHQRNCVPEALLGHPGPKYEQKHVLCVNSDSAIARETARLDTAEKTYFAAYQIERDGLLQVKNNDFFAKALLLPDILGANKLVLLLAICLFISLVYIDLQSILMKFSIDQDDEYHTNLKAFTANYRGLTSSKLDHDQTLNRKKVLLNQREADEEILEMDFEADMKATDAKLLRVLEVQGKIDILRSKGYDELVDELEKILKKYTSGKDAGQAGVAEIFRMTQAMHHQVEEIRKNSTAENLAENIFTWITENITYDQEHTKEHYRTAREAFNEKRMLCGEGSVLYIAMLRSLGIKSAFVEVFKDNSGKEVAHGCVIIKNADGTSFLSDVAYKAFKIEHIEWRELTDEELYTKYQNWNS